MRADMMFLFSITLTLFISILATPTALAFSCTIDNITITPTAPGLGATVACVQTVNTTACPTGTITSNYQFYVNKGDGYLLARDWSTTAAWDTSMYSLMCPSDTVLCSANSTNNTGSGTPYNSSAATMTCYGADDFSLIVQDALGAIGVAIVGFATLIGLVLLYGYFKRKT